jgi:disulfide bond formation protein DsbB
MLKLAYDFSRKRIAWILLALTALSLDLTALFFQYGLELDPCVLCIYQRVAVLGIVIAGLIGLVAPTVAVLRWLGLALWGVAAGWGLTLALRHSGIQLSDTVDLSCSFFAEFPSWFKLDEWFPQVFLPTGFCGEIQWSFLGLSMPNWMVIIFAAYLLALMVVLVSQFLPAVRRR